MVSKQAAAVMTMAGGVFYVAIGALIAFAAPTMSSFVSSMETSTGLGASTINAVVYSVAAFDILSGALIMLGGFLLNSESGGRRRFGGILAIIMMVLGALTSLGGLVIGFILTLLGSIFGLTYKPEGGDIESTGKSVTSYVPAQQTAQAPDYTALPGRLNYCPKCGARLREGSVYCASCGAKIPD